jgi:hypothetical protein
MSYVYEPEIEEEDDGYSIPKILVAVLLLVLIGAGVYIYFQQKKLTTSVSYLLDSKKQAEVDLNEMIEKYNLAIDDNGSLESELREERDALIKYRDSIKKIKKEDINKNTNFKQEIQKLKERISVKVVDTKTIKANPVIVDNTPNTVNETVENNKTEELNKTESANITSTASIDNTKDSTIKEIKKPASKTSSFKRVEIPPTYPGCSGTPTEKRACFSKKVKKHLARKFNASIVNELELEPGRKRIWINFDIDKFGRVTNVKAKGPNNMQLRARKKLEEEAVKTIKKLPKMVAARQNGSSVDMNYSVPLSFIVQ